MQDEDKNGNDLEKQLKERQEQLEAEQAKQISSALLAKRLADEEVAQRRRVEALDALVKEKGLLLLMTPAALAEALDNHGLEYDENGLRELISKRPSIVDKRFGRTFLQDVPEMKPEPKPKTLKDFPSCKSEFSEVEKIEFLNQFTLEQWEALPLKPRASATPLSKMTWEDWRSLSYAQKTAHINTLTEMGRDAEEYIARLPRKQNS